MIILNIKQKITHKTQVASLSENPSLDTVHEPQDIKKKCSCHWREVIKKEQGGQATQKLDRYLLSHILGFTYKTNVRFTQVSEIFKAS